MPCSLARWKCRVRTRLSAGSLDALPYGRCSSVTSGTVALGTMFDPTRPGPFYEDFVVGATLPALPSVTLTESDNVVYRAITGDQHALASDASLYRWVSGGSGRLANPGMVMQYSIGQTTMATRQAIANLYYRSVRVLRAVELGETLATATTVLGLKDSSPKGEQHRGKVWLGISTKGDHCPVV